MSKKYLNLKEWRNQYNISQMNLEKETKISFRTIRRFEQDNITEDEIDFNSLYKLAHFFNKNPEDLFTERSDENE